MSFADKRQEYQRFWGDSDGYSQARGRGVGWQELEHCRRAQQTKTSPGMSDGVPDLPGTPKIEFELLILPRVPESCHKIDVRGPM